MRPYDVLAPIWVRDLAKEFGLTLEQAAGLVGNFGFESNGFQTLQEISPVSGRGGLGPPQWTGPRRRAFEAWCRTRGLKTDSEEGSYGFIVAELRGAYRFTITALKRCQTIEQAVWSVGQTYERPGGTNEAHLPGYAGRLQWAQRALAGAKKAANDAEPSAPSPHANLVPPSARDLQTILQALGYYRGAIDGDFGPQSQAALAAYYDAVQRQST